MTRELVLYTRAGCTLCDHLLLAAEPIARQHGLAIRRIDVDDDPELQRRYRLDVPVLALGDREICRHRFDADALEKALAVK